MMRNIELLSPAGDFERLKLALKFGADAVYLGGEQFGMRTNPSNFNADQLKSAVELAHSLGKKIYLTCNTLPRNQEMEYLPEFLKYAADIRVDAFIIADIGVMALAKKYAPDVEIHMSTQVGIVNYQTANTLYDMGAKRIVTARELSLAEIKVIREKTPSDLEIEVFVHGAMCMSFSGRCILSDYMVGRDANRGDCAQPCRWKYSLVEETRPGQYFPVNQDESGTYIFNSRDLCMIEHIPELLEAGIDSLKIEGRMKTALYVAVVARTYRRAIDDYLEDEEKYRKNMDWYRAEIAKCTYRQFSTGFYFGKPDETSQIYDNSTYVSEYTYLGIVEEVKDSLARIEQRNKFCAGDMIEIMKPDGSNVPVTVEAIYNAREERVDSAPHPRELLWVKLQSEQQSLKNALFFYKK